MNKKTDAVVGFGFAVATLLFIALFLSNDLFFSWVFQRHHNVLSWYIRPLFIIPIVIFAFRKRWSGIFASIFALFTSMFWFPAPAQSSPQVMAFLAYEMDYLNGPWTAPKLFMTLLVPLFFVLLIASAWQRSWKLLLGTVAGAAILKVLWSVIFSGEAGLSIVKPALLGFILCIGALYFYLKKRKPLG